MFRSVHIFEFLLSFESFKKHISGFKFFVSLVLTKRSRLKKIMIPDSKKIMRTYSLFSGRILLDIPCKVCHDHGSGKHYGIFACDGCAGFFKVGYCRVNCNTILFISFYIWNVQLVKCALRTSIAFHLTLHIKQMWNIKLTVNRNFFHCIKNTL